MPREGVCCARLSTNASALDGLEHEIKYPVASGSLAAVEAYLRGSCRPESPHAESWVDSIYFDTPGLDFYGEKAASDLKKTKVRVRWYDGGGPVFAEVKRRYGSRRSKWRAVCGLASADLEAAGLAADGLHDIPRRLAATGENLPRALLPVVRVGYLRRRWVCPDGQRVSFDSVIRASSWALRLAGPAPAVELAGGVLEVKGPRAALPAVLAPLAALGCRRRSFSKYGVLMARLLGEEMGDA